MASKESTTEGLRVVLVHGAWADVSSWDKVIPLLLARGLDVAAAPIPMTSLGDDVAAVKRAFSANSGPVILVGHAWGGMVITEAGGDDRVAALVYVAGFAPSVGESVIDLSRDFAMPPGLQQHTLYGGDGFLRMTAQGMAEHFAHGLSLEQMQVMLARQSPIAGMCLCEKATVAAWTSKPSWCIVAENDRMISPDLQRAMARKIGAHTIALSTGHAAMLSKPQEVADVIVAAADSVLAHPQSGAQLRRIHYPLNGSAHAHI